MSCRQESGIPVLYLGVQQVNLSIILNNYEEPAYDAALYVTHPNTLSYVGRKVVVGFIFLHCLLFLF